MNAIAAGLLPGYVWITLIAGCLVLLGAALYLVAKVVLGTSDAPAQRLAKIVRAARGD